MPKLSPRLSIKTEKHDLLKQVAMISVKASASGNPFDSWYFDDGELRQASFRISPKTAKALIKELQKLVKKGAK